MKFTSFSVLRDAIRNKLIVVPPTKPSLNQESLTSCGSLSTVTLQTVLNVLSALDVIKGGLVEFQGGARLDRAYICLPTDSLTYHYIKVMRSWGMDVSAVRQGWCDKSERDALFTPFRWDAKAKAYNLAQTSPSYVGIDRVVMRLNESSSKSAISFILSYLEVLLDAFPKMGGFPASDVYVAWKTIANWPIDQFVGYAKYCTAYPMAKHLKNELPKKPFGFDSNPLLFGPRMKRVMRSRYPCMTRKSDSFFQSVLQGVKRGAAVVPEVYVAQSYVKHLDILSKKPSDVLEGIADEISEKMDRIFSGFYLSDRKILEWWEPSKKASFTYKGYAGGQEQEVISYLDAIAGTQKRFTSSGVLTGLEGGEKGGAINLQKVHDWETFKPIIEKATSAYHDVVYRDLMYNDLLRMYDETESGLVESLSGRTITLDMKRQIIDAAYDEFFDKSLDCRVVAIREFLKVRIITAGSGIAYHLAKNYQKGLLQHIQKYPQFRLTGEPLTPEHIHKVFDLENDLDSYIFTKGDPNTSKWAPREFMVSGDYSAATDNINIAVTLQSFDSTFLSQMKRNGSTLSIKYFQLIRKLLEPHNLVYDLASMSSALWPDRPVGELTPEFCDMDLKKRYPNYLGSFRGTDLGFDDDKFYVVFKQINGQLMGSPISFPFLCAINLVSYWISLEIYLGFSIPLRLLPVLINGDDIFFRSNDDHYSIWLRLVEQVGFKLSLGKNYVHPTIMTMNSILFKLIPDQNQHIHSLVEIPYFNPGLLMSQSKGSERDWSRKLTLQEMYLFSVGDAQDKIRAHKRFIHYNLQQIKLMTDNGKFNLFIPRKYGGLGFPVIEEVIGEINITSFQRRFARFFYHELQQKLLSGKMEKKDLAAFIAEPDLFSKVIRSRHSLAELSFFPYGPLPEGWVPYQPPRQMEFSPLESPARVDVTSLYSTHEELTKYRLPSKRVYRRFSRYQKLTGGGEMTNSMSDYDLLHDPLVVLARRA